VLKNDAMFFTARRCWKARGICYDSICYTYTLCRNG